MYETIVSIFLLKYTIETMTTRKIKRSRKARTCHKKRPCTSKKYAKGRGKAYKKQRGGNSATLRDPVKYDDLIDVIRDPEERDGFSAPVLMSRSGHDEMFGVASDSTMV